MAGIEEAFEKFKKNRKIKILNLEEMFMLQKKDCFFNQFKRINQVLWKD
jgi:hypothetical protein